MADATLPQPKPTEAPKRPFVLMILDGYGVNPKPEANAVALARTPVLDELSAHNPSVLLDVSEVVGLPNSEEGHMNIGAGRVTHMVLGKVSKDIVDGTFFQNPVLIEAVQHAKRNGTALHLMGLASDGGVHSEIEHLYALLELAKRNGLENVYVHPFLDGRDVPIISAKKYIQGLEAKMEELGVGKIATIGGRFYGMDRDKRWDRVQKAYAAMVFGVGETATSALGAIDAAYAKGETDEVMTPHVITDENGNPLTSIKSGDSVVFFNSRPDRARELTHAFTDAQFDSFERGVPPKVHFACMTQYDETLAMPYAYEPVTLSDTLVDVLTAAGKRVLKVAETEKFKHVTSFFNGGSETPAQGEDWFLVPSPKVSTYDLKPSMSAYEVAQKVVDGVESGKYDVVIVNFANPDMVGHTANLRAVVEAVEAVDECVGIVRDAVKKAGGKMLIMADHGNSEMEVDYSTGEPYSPHTRNPIRALLVADKPHATALREGEYGKRAGVAPTILSLEGIEPPPIMTGKILFKPKTVVKA